MKLMKRLPQHFPARSLFFMALGLLAACAENEAPDGDLSAVKPPESVRVTPAPQALESGYLPTLDPATMHEAEIGKVVKDGPRCDFRYTGAGKPVLAMSGDAKGAPLAAVVKLNGHLVALRAATADAAAGPADRILMVADPVRISVKPDTREPGGSEKGVRRREAEMVFEVGKRLTVGYRGYLDCAAEPAALLPRRRR